MSEHGGSPVPFFEKFKKKVAGGITPYLIAGAIHTEVILHAKKVQNEAADDRAVAAEFNRENDNPNELRQIDAETPEEAQQKINKILTLVDQGKIAPEALNKIDQGMLIITQMKVDGQITPEEAKELQQLLTTKRDKYKKMV